MINDLNYKKLSLFIILDAYVTKNAIIDFLNKDHSEFINAMVSSNSRSKLEIEKEIKKFQQELSEIEEFLNDEENIHWNILGLDKKFFDEVLPPYKRKIQWFRSIDRYPFDYRVFFPSLSENIYL